MPPGKRPAAEAGLDRALDEKDPVPAHDEDAGRDFRVDPVYGAAAHADRDLLGGRAHGLLLEPCAALRAEDRSFVHGLRLPRFKGGVWGCGTPGFTVPDPPFLAPP